MFFILYLALSQSKRALADPNPTPETYPLAVSTRQMKITNNYECNVDDPDCPFDDLSNPEITNCGQTCWSNDGSAVFEYTFKGVQFVLYGKKANDHGQFELIIDDGSPYIIDEHSSVPDENALLFTSDVLDYKEHKVLMKGTGKKFELFRLSYWPKLKVKRLNSTDFTSTGSWVLESDENGGTRHYTNNIGARKSISLEGSKVWVYATEYQYHGIMNVKFHTLDADINTYGPVRKDGILLYESEELPFGLYNLDISCKTPDILIYCVYYEYDPPAQTKAPFPSRSYSPETDQTYINKQFTGLNIPNEQIIVSKNSNINQISGCTFTDITENKNYFMQICKEIPFFDNRIQFTAIRDNMPAPIWTDYVGKFTVSNCVFVKCVSRINKGNVLTSNVATEVTFDGCTFLNCGNDVTQAITKFYSASASVKYASCTFYFDIETLSCPAISGESSNVVIDHCSFTKCAAVNIDTQTNPTNTKIFQFTNNIVTSSNQRVINVNNFLHTKPIIHSNKFNNHNLNNSYFIVLRHDINEEIEFYNNTFTNITTRGDQKVFGGSIALWVQTRDSIKNNLVFDKCKFINNRNDWEKQPSNQGGAIQYGHSKSIANVEMKFIGCEFTENQCTYGNGGAIACSINHDLYISDCIFENNNALKGGAIYIWGKIIDPTSDQQVSDPLQMQSITITNCQFRSNKGTNGHAIFIEQDNIEKVKLDINKCTFSDNGDKLDSSMIVSYCGEVIFEDNNVQYSDKTKACGALNLNVPRTLSFINSNFTNCATSSATSVTLSGQTESSTTTIKKCNFIDCKASQFTIIVTKGTAEVEDCSITFSNNQQACGCIKLQTKGLSCKYSKFARGNSKGALTYDQTTSYKETLLVTNCIFEECAGGNTRCFNIKGNTGDITFSHNIIQKMKNSGNSGYFGLIDFYSMIDNFVFENTTFLDNLCDSEYGGGSGLWVTKTAKITFNNCKFINNAALKSPSPRGKYPPEGKYYTGDGGGIQYGYSDSLYKIDMIFTSCTFKRNKAVRHGGAIALQTVQKVEIIGCIFEENVADYKQPSTAELLYDNHYFKKTEGRGGALYFNPTFRHKDMKGENLTLHMTDVKIEGCTFSSNSAFDGYAIYIEGDDAGTKFIINNNKFTNNYDRSTNTFSRGIITSEILNLYEGKIESSNTFDPYNSYQKQYQVVYVDHSGRTPDPTPMPTIFNIEFDDSICEPRCYNVATDTSFPQCINVTKKLFEDKVNKSESGGGIYFIDTGLHIVNSEFIRCGSEAGGGGGIYINNNMVLENNIIIENVEFKECSSYYGGAVYIHSISEYDNILIKDCKFDSNYLLTRNTRDNLFGGSALYLHARNGDIVNSSFVHNKGKGGSLKVINDFDSVDGVKLLNPINALFINNCMFDDNDLSSSYINYIGGNSKSSFDVSNCIFKGDINNGIHYIDALQMVKDMPRISITSCSFNAVYKENLNFEKDSNLINLKKQYNDDDLSQKKSSFNLLRNPYLLIVPTLAVFAVFAVVFVVKKTRQNQQSSENEQEDI